MNNLSVGSAIYLEIRGMGINGEGIGYFNKLAVFVPGAIKKENVYVKITEAHDNYAVGEINEITRKSTKRVEPFCKFYTDCGACTFQHIEYKEQLKIKQYLLENALKKYARIDTDSLNISKTEPSDDLDYRNKSQMPLRDTSFGLSLGLYKPNTNHFVYIDECPIQKPLVNEVNKEVLHVLNKYNQHTKKEGGVLKYLIVRALDSSMSAQVTFVLEEYKEIYNVIAQELTKIEAIKSVSYTIQTKGSISLFGDKTILLSGSNYIKDEVLGLRVSLSPKSFYQLNKSQSEKLYKEIVDSEINENDIVFDGYCGIGILGLLMAKKAKHVYSVDFNSDSIRNAIIIARENDIKNVTFYSDRIESRVSQLIKDGVKPTIAVLDPPRSGLDKEVINTLKSIKVKKIYYISCNPSTLGKNLNDMLDLYKIEYIKPYDFFPETAHVESLVLLSLKDTK